MEEVTSLNVQKRTVYSVADIIIIESIHLQIKNKQKKDCLLTTSEYFTLNQGELGLKGPHSNTQTYSGEELS